MTECNVRGDRPLCCTRREAIRQLLGLAGVAFAAPGRLDAQVQQTTGRVDLHHHFFPPTPLLKKFMADAPAPGPIFGYTPGRSLEAMDRAGVARAMLSCPVPFGDDPAAVRTEARVFCREANEFGARLVADHKGRFGLLAALPMIDVDGSLRELAYAFDTLGADGVGLGYRAMDVNGLETTRSIRCSRSSIGAERSCIRILMTGRAATICYRTRGLRSSSPTPTQVAPSGISSTTAPIPPLDCRFRPAISDLPRRARRRGIAILASSGHMLVEVFLAWWADSSAEGLGPRVWDALHHQTLGCITCDASTTTPPVPPTPSRCRD